MKKIILLIISLSSCNGGITYSYGYFRYKINKDNYRFKETAIYAGWGGNGGDGGNSGYAGEIA